MNGRPRWLDSALLALLLAATGWTALEVRLLRSETSSKLDTMDMRVRRNTETTVWLGAVLQKRGIIDLRSPANQGQQ